jgi:hypothetical protein
VTAVFPRPKSETKEVRDVNLDYSSSANTLVLTARPADGNYGIEIQATVLEGNPIASPATPSSANKFSKVDTILITWEQKYYDDVAACIKRLRDINERYAKSRKWPSLNPGDPVIRVLSVIKLMQAQMGAASPVMAEQLDWVTSAYASLGKRSALQTRLTTAQDADSSYKDRHDDC